MLEFTLVNWRRRVIRLSAQLYNHEAQYERLAEALVAELKIERGRQPRCA